MLIPPSKSFWTLQRHREWLRRNRNRRGFFWKDCPCCCVDETLRPDADSISSGWSPSTGATLFGVIDEVTADDSDYIEQDEINLESKVTLSNRTTTGSINNTFAITIRARVKLDGSTATFTNQQGKIRLYEGATARATLTTGVLTTSFADYSYALTGTEIDSITDFDNLLLGFQADGLDAVLSTLEPDSDVSIGSWTEDVGDGDGFIFDELDHFALGAAKAKTTTDNDTFELTHQDPAFTPYANIHTITPKWPYMLIDGLGSGSGGTYDIKLFQGATEIAARNGNTWPANGWTHEYVLTVAEVQAITDWNNLRIKVTSHNPNTTMKLERLRFLHSNRNSLRISQAELEILCPP